MIATLEWRKLPDATSQEIWERVVAEPDAKQRDGLAGYEASLSFYKRIKLVQLTRVAKEADKTLPSVYTLHTNTDDLLPLDGTSTPIHAANELDDLKLTQDTVADYIRFFCFAVHGASGPFIPLEHLPLALQNTKSSYA